MSKRDKGVNIHIKTSECDKMLKVASDSQKIGEFLEWLQNEREITLCEENGDEFYPARIPIERLLAEYFEIDLDKVEAERSAILGGLRAANTVSGN